MEEKIKVGNFEIRPYQPGDEDKINETFNRVFNTSRSINGWKWKFKKPNDSRILLAYNQNKKLITHYAVTTDRFQFDSRSFTIGQSLDTFSVRHPDAIRLKLFENVVRHFFGLFGSKKDVAIMYGFPGTRILKLGTMKLDYGTATPIQYWEKEITDTATHVIKNKPNQLFVPNITKLNGLWNRSKNRYPASIIRDGNWFFKRYLSKPSNNYQYIAHSKWWNYQCFAVYITQNDTLQIIDIVWNGKKKEDVISLEKSILNRARYRGIKKMSMWLSGDSNLEQIFKDTGWQIRKEPHDLHFVVKTFDTAIPRDEVRSNFYMTKGCTDII